MRGESRRGGTRRGQQVAIAVAPRHNQGTPWVVLLRALALRGRLAAFVDYHADVVKAAAASDAPERLRGISLSIRQRQRRDDSVATDRRRQRREHGRRTAAGQGVVGGTGMRGRGRGRERLAAERLKLAVFGSLRRVDCRRCYRCGGVCGRHLPRLGLAQRVANPEYEGAAADHYEEADHRAHDDDGQIWRGDRRTSSSQHQGRGEGRRRACTCAGADRWRL